MKLVVDANELFAGIIAKGKKLQSRTQMNADNQDFKYFDGLVDGGDYESSIEFIINWVIKWFSGNGL